VRPPPAPFLALLAALLALAPAAQAQVSGAIGIASDYRLRGVSLTDGRGVATFGINYDHSSGVYVGGSVVAHDPSDHGPRLLGYQVYAGVAGRFAAGPSWDLGVSRVDMSPYFDRRYSLEYTQAYVGLSQGGLSARLSLAENYPRRNGTTAYAELNGALRPAESWRLTGHVGALSQLEGSHGDRTRYDVAVGVVREFRRGEAYLSWVTVTPRPAPSPSWTRPGLVAGLSAFF
jgi:uncharacterized protein (TIGR02001 family)